MAEEQLQVGHIALPVPMLPPNVRHERRAKGCEEGFWNVRSMEGLGDTIVLWRRVDLNAPTIEL